MCCECVIHEGPESKKTWLEVIFVFFLAGGIRVCVGGGMTLRASVSCEEFEGVCMCVPV